MESEPGKAPTNRRKRGFWGRDPVDLSVGHHFRADRSGARRWDKQGGDLVDSDAFCGTLCHTMTWSSAAYHQGPHFINASGVRASCGQCHIPYDSSHATATEYVEAALVQGGPRRKKISGMSRARPSRLRRMGKATTAIGVEFESYTKAHNYITCRGCHSLRSVLVDREAA